MKRKHSDQDETVGEYWRVFNTPQGGSELSSALRVADPVLGLLEPEQSAENFLKKLSCYGSARSANLEFKSSSGVLDFSRPLRKE